MHIACVVNSSEGLLCWSCISVKLSLIGNQILKILVINAKGTEECSGVDEQFLPLLGKEVGIHTNYEIPTCTMELRRNVQACCSLYGLSGIWLSVGF